MVNIVIDILDIYMVFIMIYIAANLWYLENSIYNKNTIIIKTFGVENKYTYKGISTIQRILDIIIIPYIIFILFYIFNESKIDIITALYYVSTACIVSIMLFINTLNDLFKKYNRKV